MQEEGCRGLRGSAGEVDAVSRSCCGSGVWPTSWTGPTGAQDRGDATSPTAETTSSSSPGSTSPTWSFARYREVTGADYDPYWEIASVVEHSPSSFNHQRVSISETRLRPAVAHGSWATLYLCFVGPVLAMAEGILPKRSR